MLNKFHLPVNIHKICLSSKDGINLPKIHSAILDFGEIIVYLHSQTGALAEWLGAGLQNLSQWFDSATHLLKCLWSYSRGICYIKSLLNPSLIIKEARTHFCIRADTN